MLYRITRPKSKKTSPTLVTRKAFLAAEAADGFSYQNPINRYEQTPINSQKININRNELATTSPYIAAMNKDISAKYLTLRLP